MATIGGGRASRAAFLGGAAAASVGLIVGDRRGHVAHADDVVPGGCADSVRDILNAALIAEQIAATFYYAGLTSPAVLRDRRLGGSSADPNRPDPPPRGTPSNVKSLQAVLDAEHKHAALLAGIGGRSPYTRFHFPATTFQHLGDPQQQGSFLAMMGLLETAFVDAYAVAVAQLLTLGRADLAEPVARIMGVEAEHRVLARMIANLDPPNDLTLERVPFACVGDVGTSLQPFLTGQGFGKVATVLMPLPDAASVARIVGTYYTRLVTHFL